MATSNFIKRCITAAILTPLTICLIFAPPAYFTGVLLVILAIAAWEWAKLIGYKSKLTCAAYAVLLVIIALAFTEKSILKYLHYDLIMPLNIDSWLLLNIALYSVLTFWILAIAAIVSYPATTRFWQNKYVLFIAGILYLLPCVVGLSKLQTSDSLLVLYLLTIIWAMDIGAYLVGKKYGKHKILPKVSPGKSYQGLLGGIAAVLGVSSIFILLSDKNIFEWSILLIGALTAVISVFGDLFESMIKRIHGVKDSGDILAGHGGMLDRTDSLTIAVPFFAGILMVLL